MCEDIKIFGYELFGWPMARLVDG